MTEKWFKRISALLIFAANAPLVVMADDLPDVRPDISGFIIASGSVVSAADVAEGCARRKTGRRLLRFDQFTWNDGPGDISLGDPGCPDCATTLNPVCTNPLFECSQATGHNHPHLKGFASYTIRRESSPKVIARGHKEGWCMVDDRCNDGVTPKNPPVDGHLCTYLTAGCADVYPSDLGCQYVDITSLPAGKYQLNVALNSTKIFQESNYSNNSAVQEFQICRPSRTITVTINPTSQDGGRDVRILATVPLQRGKTLNPQVGPVHVAAGVDGSSILDVQIPSDGESSNCSAVDGWTKGDGRSWQYVNNSGLTGTSCSDSSRGLRQIKFEPNSKGTRATFDVRLHLPTGVLSGVPHGFVFRIIQNEDIVGNDTCAAADAVKCRTNRKTQLLECI